MAFLLNLKKKLGMNKAQISQDNENNLLFIIDNQLFIL